MRKITATLVGIALIGTLVSWVPYVFAHHEEGPVQIGVVGDAHHHSEDAGDCDHCCHYSAHVVALMYQNDVAVSCLETDKLISPPTWPVSYEAVPPGPPPKALV